MAQTFGSLAGSMNTVISFAKNVGGMIGYFRGKEPHLPEGTKPQDVKDLVTTLDPVAKDPRASITFTATGGSTVNITQVVVTSEQANAIENRARNWLAKQKIPSKGLHQQVLFYFFQVREAGTEGVGD